MMIQRNRAWCPVLIAVFAVMSCGRANAQSKTAVEFFAEKKPGDVITKSEFANYVAHRYQQKHPVDFTDALNADERQKAFDKWEKRLNEHLATEIEERFHPGLTRERVDRGYGTRPKLKLPDWWPENLMIRRSYDEAAISSPTPRQEAQGALFSFTRDFETGSDIWEARGSIMLPLDPIPEKLIGRFGVAGLRVMPSISFDRLANRTDETKEVDSLVLRIGAEAIIDTDAQPDSELKFHLLRANLAYATDFDLESSVVAGEFEWEPYFKWSEKLRRVPLLRRVLQWRVRTYLRAEIGEVTATGNKASLKKDDSFFRFGPKVQLELFPLAEELAGLSFVVKYEYLEGSSGQPGNSDLFEASMNYAFDPEGHVSLSLAYRNGDVPLTKEAVDSLVIGLSVKF